MSQRIGILIQARMESSRLPGKVLMPIIDDKSMLLWIIEQMKRCKHGDLVSVVTTNSQKEKPLIDMLKKSKIAYFLGSEKDVLNRYYKAALFYKLDHIVRITGDNPFVSPRMTDLMIMNHTRKNVDFTYLKNTPVGTGLGMGIISFSCLSRVNKVARENTHREHVITYIIDNPREFKINIISINKYLSYPEYRLTVDYKEDFILAKIIFSKLKKINKLNSFDIDDVINLVKTDNKVYNLMSLCKERSKKG